MNEDIGDLLVDVKKNIIKERHNKKGIINYCSIDDKDGEEEIALEKD